MTETKPHRRPAETNEALVTQIGLVTMRWATLDLMLFQVLIMVLQNVEAAHNIVFNLHGAGLQRLNTFKDVVGGSQLSQEDRNALIDIATRAASMLGTRNEIVHSPIVAQYEIQEFKFERKLLVHRKDGQRAPLRTDRIDRHLDQLEALLTELEYAIMSLIDKALLDLVEE